MQTQKTMPYTMQIEGNITAQRVASMSPGCKPENAEFMQGDACNLPEDLGPADAVLAANLLCRLPEPRKFLQRLPTLVSFKHSEREIRNKKDKKREAEVDAMLAANLLCHLPEPFEYQVKKRKT